MAGDAGYFAHGVLHFQYEPRQDVFFDGTFISSLSPTPTGDLTQPR